MSYDHINQNKMKLMTLLTLFLPAGNTFNIFKRVIELTSVTF